MSERFIVYFDGEHAAWLNAADELARGTLVDAALAADGRETSLLLPGERVLCTRVQLPPIRQARRRQQAAAFALEDQLASRVDDLHFALAPRADSDGETPVLVVDRAFMTDTLDACTQADLDVVLITADALAQARASDDAWAVTVVGDRVLTRTTDRHAFACETNLWSTLAAGCDAPARLVVTASAGASAADRMLESLAFDPAPSIERETGADADAVFATLLAGADTATAINLRQGAYARTSAMRTWWQPFKITAGLAAAWLVVAIAARGIESWQLNTRIEALEARSESAFREAFPEVRTINDLRVQAQQNIRALRGGGGSGGVFSLLQATAEVAGQAGDLTIQSMQYRDGALYLSMRGESVQSLESLRAGFARQPRASLNVESADAASDGVQIRASVTEQAA